MKTRGFSWALLFVGGLLAAAPVSGQFVPISRCHAAYPCGFPFMVQYRPDPLLAAQYGNFGNTGLSVRVALKSTFEPEIDRSRLVDEEAVNAAVRAFLLRHPLRLPRPAAPSPGPDEQPSRNDP